jgi:hypothetical protein
MWARTVLLACALMLPAACAEPSPGEPVQAFSPGATGWDPLDSASPAAPAARSSLPPVSPVSPAAPDSADQAVAAAVAGYWARIQQAAASPRSKDKRLTAFATGRALAEWQSTITRLAAGKRRYTGQVGSEATAGVVRARTATAVGCVDRSRWILVDAKGTRVGRPTAPARYAYQLVKVGRQWKVTDQKPAGACSPGLPGGAGLGAETQ